VEYNQYEPTEEALRIAEQCYPFLAGEPSMVQGAALGELVAKHIAGHVIPNNREATAKLRAEMLAMFVNLVESLIPLEDEAVIQPELERRRANERNR
jgi:hypothetical protein